MSNFDTIILGSSPNALTAACYLARGGKKVLVLEPTEHLGGAYATTEFSKGFKGDVSLTSGRIDADICKDLKLADHGLEVIERSMLTSLLGDGKSFSLSSDHDEAAGAIRKFSPKDADRYKSFLKLLDLATDFLKNANAVTPPQNHPPTNIDIEQFSLLSGKLKGYGKREMTEVIRLLVMSVRDLMDEWFENAELKGLLASVAVRGLNQGSFAGSTTYNLLHQLAQGDGFFPSTAKGGVGALSQALAKAAQSSGAEIRTKVGALRVNIADGVATGVNVGGADIVAQAVISDYDARYTFTHLVDPPELTPEFNRALRHVRYQGAVARINLALKELPRFDGLSADALKGTLVLSPSVAYLERAFDDGKKGAYSTHPYMEVTVPSAADPSLAPDGKHVMSIWYQFVPYRNNAKADKILETTFQQLSAFSPNLKSLVEASQVLLPHDFEKQFDLTEGQLYGGEVNLAQAFYLRPLPGYAGYHTPISRLYMCGAATHPGGINGLSGKNAARELGVRDLVAV